jgi:signal transduction histidine kinase/ABC-type uncharacterized transport system substrate-binding protein
LPTSTSIRHRQGRRVFNYFLGLALLLGVAPPLIAADPEDLLARRRVLLLSSESRAFPAVVMIGDAIRSRFASAGLFPELFTEYLDLSSAVDPRYGERLRALLQAKHGHRKVDVVIVGGVEGLRFALANRATLFPAAPIIFCAVPPGIISERDLPPDVTGTWMTLDASATLDAAVRLQPRARQVVVVSGAAQADRLYLGVVKQQLAGRSHGLDVSYLDGLTLEEVRNQLSRLSRDTIVLYVTIQRDGAGRTFSAAEALKLIAPASGAPIYGLSNTFLGSGILGGSVFTAETQGSQAADIANRLLRGDPAWRVAPAATTNAYMFDWHQLKRWGFREADLPHGSVVMNRPRSVWELYRWPIAGVIAVIALQAALLVGLLAQAGRRRRVEATLRDRLEFETLVSGLSATLAGLRADEVHRGIAEGLRRVGEHLGVDRVTILQKARGSDVIEAVHVWRRPGAPVALSSAPRSDFPWLAEQIGRGQVVRFSRLRDLPDDAAVDRETFARIGITSAVSLPLIMNGKPIGALSLSLLGRERQWPDDLVKRLEFVAGIFSSALLRHHNVVELEKLRHDLSHVGRLAAMSELTASLAHELNQPLASILNNAQAGGLMLDSGVEDLTEIREILSDIVADDKRASEVIRGLRTFIGKDEMSRNPVDVNVVVQDVLTLVRSDAIIRNVSLEVDLDPGLPPVLVDRVQLQQVLVNLVMNAFDALDSTGERRITVTTHRVGTAIHLSVKDSGHGIPAEDLSRIFDRFYTTKSSGLGMGLSIARSLVEAHGGHLRAENNKDGGATFIFTVPVIGEDAL